MTLVTHDTQVRATGGLAFAVVSAASFGLSGALASGLMDAGWSAGAAVTARVLIAAAILTGPAVVALRGRWRLLREHLGMVAAYGVIAVAGCQLAYFNAVRHLDVGVALLVEYTAPVAVVLWVWVRHSQRPGRLTMAGALVAAVGLVLVLGLAGAILGGGTELSSIGLTWALVAMVGAAVYFVLSARDTGLPPLVLAAAGLVLGGGVLLLAGLTGVLEMTASTASVDYNGTRLPVWVPLAVLGVVTAALAYVTGIAASRRLGPRLASFVALLEVLFGLVWAGLLLHQVPAWGQVLGAALVLAGLVLVKLGESDAPVAPVPPAGPRGARAVA